MVGLEYYNNRLDSLESRKNEVLGKLTTDRLTLKGINTEIEKCNEAIDNLTPKPIDVDKSKDEIEIVKLTIEIEELLTLNKKLSRDNEYFKEELSKKDNEIFDLKNTIKCYELCNKGEISESNIFKKLLTEEKTW